ncbi:MAG: hypothetical protein HXS46_19225 [Theionarchaea archaeon]|nr:MAG: hypothetical protein AYK18_04385 [Theionarchaea archaeon DG-70]MBU7012821.1 hypothetical protein [Theionarchaea archaeon]
MIDCTFYVEAQSNSKIAVENSLQELLREMKQGTDVVESAFEEILEHEHEGQPYYSGVLRLRIKADFRTYVALCMRLTPTAIDLNEGKEMLEKKDLLKVFGDISSRITKLSKKLGIAIQQTGGRIQEKPGIDPYVIDETLNYGGLLMKMVFEGQSNSEEQLKEAVMESVNASGGFVNKMNSKRTEGPEWTGVVGMEVLFEDIEDVFLAVVKLIPVAMSIVEPETTTLSMLEIQNIGMDLSEVVHSFVTESMASQL